jgi:hypothetical protein
MLSFEKYRNLGHFSSGCIRDKEKKRQNKRGKDAIKPKCEPWELGLWLGMHYSVKLIYISNKLIKSQ